MELSLNALAELAENFLSTQAAARHRHLSGLGPRPSLAALVADFPALGRADTFLQVRQAAEDPRTDEQTRASRRRLLRFLAGAHALFAAAPALDRRSEALERPISSSLRTMPLGEALHRLAEDPERERRHALQRDATDALWERQAAWAQVIEANIRSCHQLGFASIRAQHESLTGVELQPWLDAAQQLLVRTDDAWRDLLAYVLKRLDGQLRPPAARWHDVLYGSGAPWMAGLFRAEELLPAVTRTFEELGLSTGAKGRLLIEEAPGDFSAGAAQVCPARVPDEVRLTVGRRGGMPACGELLAGFAEAHLWAHAPRSAEATERRFPDPATIEGVRLLASHFCLEEGWLKRALRIPSAAAREAARLGAFSALGALRQAAALLPWSLEVFHRGPTPALHEEYEERLGQALGVAVPRGTFLLNVEGVDPLRLRGEAQAVEVAQSLRERFDEDYFRNPATGAWFQQLATQVGVEAEAHPTAAGLAPAAQRLVRLMGN